jgi:RecA/RadA recombinase
MYQPNQADVRRFFCSVYAKWRDAQPMDALETLASQWVAEHPEYHADFADLEAALDRMYDVENGKINPFLHLAMHLSVSEQCSIDQPHGIRQAVELLAMRRDSLHQAHHDTMEALGRMIWESQRSGCPPDGHAYIDAVQRMATRD